MRFTNPFLITILSILTSTSTAYLYTHQKIPLLINNGGGTHHLTTCITLPPIWTIHIQESPSSNRAPPRNFPILCYNDGYSPLAVVACQVTRPLPLQPHRRPVPFKAVYCIPKHADDEIVSIDDHVALASQLRVPFGDDGSECIPKPSRLLRWLQNDEDGDSYNGEDYEIKQQKKVDEFHKILDTVKIPLSHNEHDEDEEEGGGSDRREPETPQTPYEMHNFADRKVMRKISGIDYGGGGGSNVKSAGRSVAASLFNIVEDIDEPSDRGTPPELRRSPEMERRGDDVVVVKTGQNNKWIACVGRVCGYFDPRKLWWSGTPRKSNERRIVPNHTITPALDTARR